MEVKPRAEMCVECPYREENKDRLEVEQYENIVAANAVFPCHMDLKKVVGSDNSGVEIYVSVVDTFMVCRGRWNEMKDK